LGPPSLEKVTTQCQKSTSRIEAAGNASSYSHPKGVGIALVYSMENGWRHRLQKKNLERRMT
jgi:hypothetical protein